MSDEQTPEKKCIQPFTFYHSCSMACRMFVKDIVMWHFSNKNHFLLLLPQLKYIFK